MLDESNRMSFRMLNCVKCRESGAKFETGEGTCYSRPDEIEDCNSSMYEV